MITSLTNGSRGTRVAIVVLATGLLAGLALFVYLGIRVLGRLSTPTQVAEAPTVTVTPAPASATATEEPTITPTSARTPVVIVAATAISYTPGPMPTNTPSSDATIEAAGAGGEGDTTEHGSAQEATPTEANSVTPTSKATARPQETSAPVATGGTEDDELPQTGLGLGVPVFGLVLAGMASAARWLRKQR